MRKTAKKPKANANRSDLQPRDPYRWAEWRRQKAVRKIGLKKGGIKR